jgi:tRNA 2-thiouridine synthesizing protein A
MPSADPSGPPPAEAELARDAELHCDAELDCRGVLCPLPVLKTREALAGLARGGVLRVVTTDPAAELDMAAFSSTSGHAIVARSRRAQELVFFFRKG